MGPCYRTIVLRNVYAVDYDPGTETVKIEIPVVPVDIKDADVLDRLFPHTGAQLDRLFAIEAIINCVSHHA